MGTAAATALHNYEPSTYSGPVGIVLSRVLGFFFWLRLRFRRWWWRTRSGTEMEPFSSPSASSGASSGPPVEALQEQIRSQLAQAYAREFVETVGHKCFSKCITKPSTSMSGSESSCVSRCIDRYIEATGVVSRALFSAHH